MKSIFKKILMLLLVLCVFTAVSCSDEKTPEEVNITITASKTTVQKGDTIDFAVEVTGTENKGYSWNISDMSLITIDISLKGTVLKNVSSKTDVIITVTSAADSTKSDTIVITVEPFGSTDVKLPKMSITASKTKVVKGDVVEFDVVVENSEDTAYTLSSSNTEYVTISENKATVIKEPAVLDLAVTITATLVSNPAVTASTSITIKAPVVEGQVGELTTDMLLAVGNPSITVTGKLTDYYEDFKNAGNNTIQSYDMTVMMEEGAWFGSWNIEGNPNAALQDVYRMGEETGVEDQFGNVGHAFLKSFINKDNEVENKKQIDYLSIPVVWEAQHLWNHLGNLNISKFVYDAENKVYFYDHQNDMEDLYLLTYLSYCLTPLLSDTLVEVYLIVENGQITKLIGQTETILQYGADASEIDARSYTRIELSFSNIGTTVVPNPTPFAAPENADILSQAIKNMAALENYTFKVKDVTTSAPSTDEGDYSIESVNATSKMTNAVNEESSTSGVKNYTSSVGEVGRVGYVTKDAVLYQDTGKYNYTMDGKNFHVSYTGLKQNPDNTYEEFAYSTDTKTLTGTKLHNGTLADVMPGFDFSANVFEFVKQETKNGVTYYTFQLREDAITRDIALELCAYSYADDAYASANTKTKIVVSDAGYIVESIFPYSLVSGTYLGHCTTTYGKFNETSLPEGTFNGYIPREIKTSWSDYLMKYYHPGFTTNTPDVDITSDVVIEEIFGQDASLIPAPTVFIKLFGDNISGPFYDWKEIGTDADGNPINRAHFSITTTVSEYDENGNVDQEAFNEFANVIIAALQNEGFTLDMANSQFVSRNNRYICMINDDVQIVIENNGTKYFWITFYVTGDWTLNR